MRPYSAWLPTTFAFAALVAAQDTPTPAAAAVKPMTTTELGTATQAFARDLWAKLAKSEGNLAFSPGSIALALAMTGAGAKGPTRAEMLRVLHLASEADLAAYGELGSRWQTPGKEKNAPAIAIANRLFGQRDYEFQKPYLHLVETAFHAPLELVDYVADPDKVRAHINAWVVEKTKDRIRDLLPEGALSKEARLTLVNAIHFLADWNAKFDPDNTHDREFTLLDGTKRKVKTMHMTSTLAFAEVGGWQVVQLPYVGKRFAMLFALPPQDAAPETWLDAKVLALPAEVPAERVQLSLPRFEIQMRESVRLRGVLSDLGMPLAFTRGADFTGIGNPRDPADRLQIDEVYHKAFVRVDEKGTEAAAATAVVMKRAGSPAREARKLAFDRPFVFVLRDLESGTPLFVGRVLIPG